jgi:hypothetical protein
MSTTKTHSIKEQILEVLQEHGPMDTNGLLEHIKDVKKDSVHSKALELMHDGFIDRDGNMVWSFVEGGGSEETPGTEKAGKGAGAAGAAGMALDARQMFEQLLKSVAVKPPEVIPTISNIFFGGDIDNLTWLQQVLRRHAAGWVAPNQIRLILSSWSQTRGLPYNESEFQIEGIDTGKPTKEEPEKKTKPTAAKVMEDAGIAYMVAKDKDGDWVPKPGGTLSYEDALASCERLNAIKAVGRTQEGGDDDDAGEEGEGRSAGKGGRRVKDTTQIILEKLLDAVIDNKGGKDGEDNAIVKELRQQNQTLMTTVQQMKEDREAERFDRMEANIAALAARDPWSDPVELARIRQAIGYQPSAVTDSSPAVQLLKDTSDKMDKNVSRLTGLVERVILQGDVFRPEETRSAEEKEHKAGALLNEASARQHSTELRKRAFDV